ncbi:MAG: DUF6527 family protein [Chitinophagaceae bacterium]
MSLNTDNMDNLFDGIESPCPNCDGEGDYVSLYGAPGEEPVKCDKCKGIGKITDTKPMTERLVIEFGNKELAFWCPGCDAAHSITYREGGWKWNGSLDKPTITPSLLVNGGLECPDVPRCHSFVTDGQIQFLADCTHEKAGWKMDIPPWPESTYVARPMPE